MKYLIIIFCLCAGCVLPGDIDALQANMDEFQAGAITKPDYDARNKEIVAEMHARTDEMIRKGKDIPTDPISLLMYGGGMLATAFGTNKYRDKRRKDRSEPV